MVRAGAEAGLKRLAFPCPCCGFLTLAQRPPGTFDICPVCFWEDDQIQFRDPDYRGGANTVSLTEARVNFRTLGASDPNFTANVRPPHPHEYAR